MRPEMNKKIKDKVKKTGRRKKWYRALSGMAAVVMFCTTYALILPAITMEKNVVCGMEEHTHDESCSSEKVLTCGLEESDGGEAHVHSDSCHTKESVLVCTESEDSHTHGDSCYTTSRTLTCGESVHSHGTGCYDEEGNLTCSQSEHSHSDSCYSESTELTCGQSEGGHTHSSSCYEEREVLICDQDGEAKAHHHTDACYTTKYTCSIPSHTHGKECYANSDSPAGHTDDDEDADDDEDSQDDEDDVLKGDPTADVENSAVWEATLPELEDENWAENIVKVAESQLGYRESEANFITDPDGNKKGYTRYGEWYGSPYGDWCAMFVSFCFNYAGIPEEAFPQNANCAKWMSDLDDLGIFAETENYSPQPGDIVFLDIEGNGKANHIGIIAEAEYDEDEEVIIPEMPDEDEITEDETDADGAEQDDEAEASTEESGFASEPAAQPLKIKVIEGNSSNSVQYVEYEFPDEAVLGYASLAEAEKLYNEALEEELLQEELETFTLTHEEAGDYTVSVTYTAEAEIPEDARLAVRELTGDEYDQHYAEAAELLVAHSGASDEEELGVEFARFFDISFMVPGEDGTEYEIEPAAPVDVQITYSEKLEISENQTASIVHFASGGPEIITPDVKSDGAPADSGTETAAGDASEGKGVLARLGAAINSLFGIAPISGNSPASPAEAPVTIEDPSVPLSGSPDGSPAPETAGTTTFTFTQDSFSVTGTIITNASNSSFRNGGKYIIYSGNYALNHTGADVVTRQSITTPVTGTTADYIAGVIWTYDSSKQAFYYEKSDGTKRYLSISNEKVVTASESDAKSTVVSNGNIIIESRYIKYDGNSLDTTKSLNKATVFTFAEIIDEQQIPLEQEMTHLKYVMYNPESDDYDLTLTVSGAKGSITNPAKVDIVLVLDRSGSMSDDDRMTNLKSAVSSMTTKMAEKPNVDSRWKVVSFASSASIDTTSWKTADDANTTVSGLSANGGTNYEAAFTKAADALSDARSDATKIVVFLSDGVPTYHGINTRGGGNYCTVEDYNGAINGAKKISCDEFYAIGLSLSDNASNYKTPEVIMRDVAASVTAGKKEVQFVDTASDLTDIFEGIVGSTTEIKSKDVTVTDTLSEYAVPAEETPVPYITVTRVSDGILVTEGNGSVTVDTDVTVTASYDSGTKQIILDFPDNYELNPEYSFAVTMKIKASPAAEAYYTDNNSYPHTGDSNTDAEGNATSSGKSGFYSNSSAKVDYTINGEAKSEDYPKPVIQVKKELIVEPEQQMTHEKYIKYNNDASETSQGTYDLTLTVSGAKGSITNPAKVDIVLVLDSSASMKDGNPTRFAEMKTAVANMTDRFKGIAETVDARWKVVTFGTSAIIENSSWVSDEDTIKTQVNDYETYDKRFNSEQGGTNYEAALTKAKTAIDSAAADATKIVVFLSDGVPTCHGTNTIGGGNKCEEDDYNGAITAATALRGSYDEFYAIGLGLSGSDGNGNYNSKSSKTIFREVYAAATGRAHDSTPVRYYEISQASQLSNIFGQISASITEFKCSGVVVTDVLSAYAEGVTDAVPVIDILDYKTGNSILTESQKGSSITFNDNGTVISIGGEGASYTVNATYNTETKQIEMRFPTSYELNPNYIFTVTLKITPTQYAVEQYIANGWNYPYGMTGEPGTDAVGNTTSSEQPGFYSNNGPGSEGRATVTYTFNGKTSTDTYKHPVIQVHNVETVELPETGGTGNLPYIAAGIVLMITAAAAAAVRRRERRAE